MSATQDASTIFRFSSFQAKLLKKQDQWLVAHGISSKEFMVMFYLNAEPANKLRRVDLAEKVGLSASGVTRLLNPMQKIGLIEKEEGARDARVSFVRLTETGKSLFHDAEQSFNQGTQSFMALLDEAERAALVTLSEARI